MLERMWRNWNSYISGGNVNSTTALENVVAVSCTVKHNTSTPWPSNSTPRDLLKKHKSKHPHKHLYMNVYSSIIHNGQMWKQPKYPKRMDNQSVVCPYNRELVLKIKSEQLTHVTRWMNFEYMVNTCWIQNEFWIHTRFWKMQKNTYSTILLIWSSGIGKINL